MTERENNLSAPAPDLTPEVIIIAVQDVLREVGEPLSYPLLAHGVRIKLGRRVRSTNIRGAIGYLLDQVEVLYRSGGYRAYLTTATRRGGIKPNEVTFEMLRDWNLKLPSDQG